MARRRSVSASRLIIRRQMPWPLRWAAFAVGLGFSAALALWAFEFGKQIAGLNRLTVAPIPVQATSLAADEVVELRSQRDKAQSVANTAESLLKAERTTQERLVAQIKSLELENLSLKADLGFFERLLPAGGAEGLVVRGLQAERVAPGQLRFQLLVMQQGKVAGEFDGRYALVLSGDLDGKPWSQPQADGPRRLQFKQYQRVEGVVQFPEAVTVRTVEVQIRDAQGAVRATQIAQL